MGAESQSTTVSKSVPSFEGTQADVEPRRRRRKAVRVSSLVVIVLTGLTVAAYLLYGEYQVFGLSHSVRRSFAARRYHEASGPLRRWLALRPTSGEAHYYKAWDALVFDQPDEAVRAIEQTRKLAFNPALVGCLSAILYARALRYDKSRAGPGDCLPRPTPAARDDCQRAGTDLPFHLSAQSGRRGGRALEGPRARGSAALNCGAMRSPHASTWTAIQILNYRAALERDPNLDEARLGLAQQLSRARRFDEARQVYHDYLKRKPADAPALIGLGRDAFQSGDLEGATHAFETALESSPRQPDALKELGLIESATRSTSEGTVNASSS